MNILITGITGFVGSNFTQSWKNHHTLYGVDITQTPKDGVRQLFSWQDLDKIPRVDAIVHLAGKAHDTKNQSEAQSYFEINTELTKKIFDYFLQSEAKTFIFFSSVKAAADTVVGEILTEDIVPKPVGPYGESKIAAENYMMRLFPSNKELETQNSKLKTKRIFILRPCMIHGAGNKGNLNMLYNVVNKGIPWTLGAYENRRSFCSIDNISYVTEQLVIQGDVPNGIYHVADDEAISTNELIELICQSMGKKTHIWHIPKPLINAMAVVGSVLHLPLNKFRLQKLTENYVVSNAKIKKALNIEKMPVSAKDGLIKTLQSFSHKE